MKIFQAKTNKSRSLNDFLQNYIALFKFHLKKFSDRRLKVWQGKTTKSCKHSQNLVIFAWIVIFSVGSIVKIKALNLDSASKVKILSRE